MNDRFKFRAWNKLSNEMKDVISLNINHEFPDCSNVILETNTFDNIKTHNNSITCSNGLNNVILMQCTGLKDKNGKLIYEGDVITDGFDKYIVEWDKDEAYLRFWVREIDTRVYYTFEQLLSYEVIGNIYENKSLLESEV